VREKVAVVKSQSRTLKSFRASEIELGEALFALSDALDLVGIDDIYHGKRVCWLSRQFLDVLGEDSLREDLQHVALIHDCGASSTRHRHGLLGELEANDGHSEAGAHLVSQFRPLAHLADAIRHHHTPWPRLVDLAEPGIAKVANLVFLADRIDVLQTRHRALDSRALVRLIDDELLRPMGHLFAPAFIDVARQVLDREDVVRVLKAGESAECARLRLGTPRYLSPLDVKGLAHLFARAVDAKSAYTARHSHGVGALSAHLGAALGLSAEDLEALEVAALLHDLGKLRVPDEVLDKPGPLDDAEWVTMRKHPQGSFQILSQVGGFARVAEIAGMHHEFLDGSGYPFGLKGEAIPIEARIITVADIFQALAQRRPYRRALEPKLILSILKDYVASNRVDPAIVRIIESDLGLAWRLGRVVEHDEIAPAPQVNYSLSA
jgi:putative nucleotidyltransferase with HDIG domain